MYIVKKNSCKLKIPSPPPPPLHFSNGASLIVEGGLGGVSLHASLCFCYCTIYHNSPWISPSCCYVTNIIHFQF